MAGACRAAADSLSRRVAKACYSDADTVVLYTHAAVETIIPVPGIVAELSGAPRAAMPLNLPHELRGVHFRNGRPRG
jgi:hypothetical protein